MPAPSAVSILNAHPLAIAVAAAMVALAALVLLWRFRRQVGWEQATYASLTVAIAAAGFVLWVLNRGPLDVMGIRYVTGMILFAVAGMCVFVGFMEYGLLRILGLFRLGAISRVTYYEGLLQPFTLIIIGTGLAVMGVTARIGFFTYNEDFKMYRDVASSFVFLFSLPVMVFASTKVIDEEIENRTMLTLMSKPVSRTQVVLGKYLGVLLLVLVTVGILGIMAAMCGYLRYFDDMQLDFRIASSQATVDALFYENYKSFMALLPSLVLTFLQVATLAAVSVAVSTRFGLAVNVTLVVIIYIAANMARFIGSTAELPVFLKPVVSFFTYLLPGLSLLDLNQRLIFSNYILGKDDWGPKLPTYGLIWKYVGLASLYSFFYICAALSFGVALFRSRELS